MPTVQHARRVHGAAIHHHDPYRGGRLRALPRIGDSELDGPVSLVAYVDRYPPMINAGAESMLHAMLRDSVRRGHRVAVATGCVSEHRVVDGVDVYPARAGKELAEDAQLVVSHLLWTNEAIRLATAVELPLVYLVHNDNQIRYWRLSEAKVSAYVWNSEWVAATCSTFSEAANIPGVVVRPPLVADAFAVTDPAPADRPFVTLVNPIEAKGAEVFYELAARMPDRRFLAVEGAYGAQRRPKRQHGNVEWQPQTGNMRDDVFARTRVLYVGSSYESWGLAAVEACAAGVPVVATPTAGLVEALGEDWPWFVPFGDGAAAAAALRKLDDPDVYAAASAGALARAKLLDEIGAADLATWDGLIRRAAAGTVERMTPHDPFRARSVDAASPETPLDAPESDGVPSLAADVAKWVSEPQSADERRDRADAAWAAETSRSGGVRKTVADAVTAALA